MTDSENLLIGDIVISVVRSPRRRRLTLEVSERGVLARAPQRMRQRSIMEFVQAKQDWIIRHVASLPEPEPEFEFADGAVVDLFGLPYRVSIQTGARKPVFIDDSLLVIPVTASHLPIEQTAKTKLIRWYKEQALAEISSLTAHYAQEMAVPAAKKLTVKVRDYKRRWGSCGYDGQLSFNWRIAQAPREVIEYVVVHELAHCHEFNHSRRFWRIVERHLPDWKERQEWLHKQGASLYRL